MDIIANLWKTYYGDDDMKCKSVQKDLSKIKYSIKDNNRTIELLEEGTNK